MAKNSFEISTFTTGVIGSPSETDIPDDAAAFSVNINPIAEDGTLTAINEDTILTSGTGFNTQAQTVQTLLINRGALVATTVVTGTSAAAENTDDGLTKLTKISHGLTAGDIIKWTSDVAGLALNGFLRVNEAVDSSNFTVNVAWELVTASPPTDSASDGIGTYVLHKDINLATQDYKSSFFTATTYTSSFEEKKYCFYFTQGGAGTDPELEGFTSVEVAITTTNTAAEIAVILRTAINAQIGFTATVDTATITITPDVTAKVDLCLIQLGENEDIPLQDSTHINLDSTAITSIYTTTGAGTPINIDDMSIINLDKKDFSLFGVDYTNDKIFKWDDLYNTNSKNSLIEFKSNLVHDDKSSIIQRNKNLFIGLGGGESFKTQWIGQVEKTQINKDLDNWYIVNDELTSMGENASPNTYDVMVSQQIFDNNIAFNEQQCYHAAISGMNANDTAGANNLKDHMQDAGGKLYAAGNANLNHSGKTADSVPQIGWCFKITDTNDTGDAKLLGAKQYKYKPSTSLVIGDVFMVVDNVSTSEKLEYIGNAATASTEPAFFIAATEGTTKIHKISTSSGLTDFDPEEDRISTVDISDLLDGDKISTISQCRSPLTSGYSTSKPLYMYYGDGAIDNDHIADQRCRPLHMMYWVATDGGNLYRINLSDFHSQHSNDDYKGPMLDAKLILDYSNIARCQDNDFDGDFKHWYGGIYGAKRFNSSSYNASNITEHTYYEANSTGTPESSGAWVESYTWSREPINSKICGVIETWNNATNAGQAPACAENAVEARYVYDDDTNNRGLGGTDYPHVQHMDHHHAQKNKGGTFEHYAADKTMYIYSDTDNRNHGFDTGNVLTSFVNTAGEGHASYNGNTIVTKVEGLNEFQVVGTHNTSSLFPYYSCKVWLLWKRKDGSPHNGWDLMLYNFYPTTVQGNSALVYDRTPPYDECEKNEFSDVVANGHENYWAKTDCSFFIQKSSQMLGASGSNTWAIANGSTADNIRMQSSTYSGSGGTNSGPRAAYIMRRDGSAVALHLTPTYYMHFSLGNFIGFDGSLEGDPRLVTPFNHTLKTVKPLEEVPEDYAANIITYNLNPFPTLSGANNEWSHGSNKHQVMFTAKVNGRMAVDGFRTYQAYVDGGNDPMFVHETNFKNYNDSVMLFRITDTGSAKDDTRTFAGYYGSESNTEAHTNNLSPFHYSDGGKFKKRCVYESDDNEHISTRGSGRVTGTNNNLYYTTGTYSLYDGTKLVPDTVPFSNDAGVDMQQGQVGDYLYIDRKWMSGEAQVGTTYEKSHNGYIYTHESEEETSHLIGRMQQQFRPYHGSAESNQTVVGRGINGFMNGSGSVNINNNPVGNTYHGFERRSSCIQIPTIKSYYSMNSTAYGDERYYNTENAANTGNKYTTASDTQFTFDINRYVPSYEILGKYAAEMRPLQFAGGQIDIVRSMDPVANSYMDNDNSLLVSTSSDTGGEFSSTLSSYYNTEYTADGNIIDTYYSIHKSANINFVTQDFYTTYSIHPRLVTIPLTPNEDLADGTAFTHSLWACGSASFSNTNKEFICPMTIAQDGYDFGGNHFDAFDYANYITQDPLLTFTNEQGSGIELPENATLKYKVTLLYDGYQESPLSSYFYSKTMSGDKSSHDVTVNISEDFTFNPRVTHIAVYRKNTNNDLYRLVHEVPLENKRWLLEEGVHKYTFRDDKRFASYSALTGMNESTESSTINYSISAQINDELFVGLAWHKDTEDDVSKYIYKSKPGNFSQFEYKKDFLVLPAIPTALASFNGKIFAFDRNNTYVINPQQMYIEDTFEGVGCLSQDAFVVTEFGMCFADSNNIYLHSGSVAQPIGNNILDVSTYEGWTLGWQKAVAYSEDTIGIDPFVFYDGPSNSFVCFVHGSCDERCNDNVSRGWVYNISRNRWDYWESPKVKKAFQGMDGDIIISDGNLVYNFKGNSTKRDWRWLSKKLSLIKQTSNKRMHRIKLQGSPTLDTISTPPKWNDDLSVYVDGEIQQLTFKDANPAKNKGFTKEFSGCFWRDESHLTNIQTTINVKGLNALDIGGLLPPVGTYILLEEEIMLVTAQPSIFSLTVTRGQLGTEAVAHTYDADADDLEGHEGPRIFNVCPVIQLPSKCRGKHIELKFENQKGSVDSFSIEFIDKGTK